MSKKNRQVDSQIKETLATYRLQYSLLTQLLTVFVIANVTVIGFGINNQNPVIFMIGAIFPFLILITRIKTSQLMLPIIYSAISLESEYETKSDWIASTYFQVLYPQKWKEIKRILNISNQMERIKELKKINRGLPMIFLKNNILITVTCFLLMLIQLLIPFVISCS